MAGPFRKDSTRRSKRGPQRAATRETTYPNGQSPLWVAHGSGVGGGDRHREGLHRRGGRSRVLRWATKELLNLGDSAPVPPLETLRCRGGGSTLETGSPKDHRSGRLPAQVRLTIILCRDTGGVSLVPVDRYRGHVGGSGSLQHSEPCRISLVRATLVEVLALPRHVPSLGRAVEQFLATKPLSANRRRSYAHTLRDSGLGPRRRPVSRRVHGRAGPPRP